MVVESDVFVLEVTQTSADDITVTFASVTEKSLVGGLLAYKCKPLPRAQQLGAQSTEAQSIVDCALISKSDIDLDALIPVIAEMDAVCLKRGNRITDESGIWNHNGIEFILRGAGVLGCAGSTTSTIRIYEGRNDPSGTMIAESESATFPSKPLEPTEVRLKKPVFIEKGRTCTVELDQRNSGGHSAVVHADSTTTIHDAVSTGTTQGSLPALYAIHQITSEFAKKILRMGGSKEIHEVFRGHLCELSDDKWKHDGSING